MILTLLLIIIQGPCQIPVTWITYKVTQTHATWKSNVHRAHIRRQVFVKKSILYTNKKWNALFGVQTFQHIDTSNLYFKWRHVNPSTLQPIISRRFNPYLFRQFNPCFAKLSNLKRVYSKDIVLCVECVRRLLAYRGDWQCVNLLLTGRYDNVQSSKFIGKISRKHAFGH